ncbi:MAG: CheB methylesterase domain-containing protein, partial [Pseudomonadota bacterium]
RAEYPMFDALLEMLNVKRVYLVGGFGRRASDCAQTPIRSEQEIKDFVVSLCRFLGVTTEPVTASDRPAQDRLVVIGSSTGGIEALLSILPHFPRDCPPTLIVQHIKGDFLASLVRRLDAACPAVVKEAEGHEVAVSGRVLVAPGNKAHLVLRPNGRRCALLAEPPETGHRPSVDRLFHSAVPYGDGVVSVLLTGMGRDGADGMRAIRDAGGWTIAQDEATSVVYGMPQAAISTGGVAEQLPLDRIGPAILKAAARGSTQPG